MITSRHFVLRIMHYYLLYQVVTLATYHLATEHLATLHQTVVIRLVQNTDYRVIVDKVQRGEGRQSRIFTLRQDTFVGPPGGIEGDSLYHRFRRAETIAEIAMYTLFVFIDALNIIGQFLGNAPPSTTLVEFPGQTVHLEMKFLANAEEPGDPAQESRPPTVATEGTRYGVRLALTGIEQRGVHAVALQGFLVFLLLYPLRYALG